MTRVPKPPEMPRQMAFLARTSQIYSAMKQRFREKRNKRGKIIRIGRELPFERDQFQNWVAMKLGGPGGAVQCRYCRKWMTALDVGFDHIEPVSQGGDIGLPNLDACCDPCNRLKGNLSYATFMRLFEWIQKAGLPGEMTLADRKNLESRLKTGGMQYRGKFVKDKPKEPVIRSEPDKSLFQKAAEDDF